MALILIFGINGSGKDTLVAGLKELRPKSVQPVMSTRILFRALGFDVDYVPGGENPSPELIAKMYKKLEQTPKTETDTLMNTYFRNILLNLRSQPWTHLLTAHLALARQKNKELWFETGFTFPWFAETFDGFVYISANPAEIYRRREAERKCGVRDRGTLSIEEITQQQEVSHAEWIKFTSSLPTNKPRIEIINRDNCLNESIANLDTFMQLLTPEDKINVKF